MEGGGQRVLSELRRVFFQPPLYANKEAGFVWDKSKFLCFLIQLRVNVFFFKLLGVLLRNQHHLMNKFTDTVLLSGHQCSASSTFQLQKQSDNKERRS